MRKKVITGVAGIVLLAGVIGVGYSQLDNKKVVQAAGNTPINSVATTIENTEEGKIQIQTKMLNSIDNFQKVSGTFEYFSTSGDFNLLVDYQTDLSGNPKSYEYVKNLGVGTDTTGEADVEISLYDGEQIQKIKEKKNGKDKQNFKVAKVTKEEREELKGTKLKDRLIVSDDGQKGYLKRTDPSYMGIATTSILPEDIAIGFLEDLSKWGISGTEEISGVNTVVITGTLNEYYTERYKGSNFKLNVDPNTGIMLNMFVTDQDGNNRVSLETKNIKINTNLNNSLFIAQ